MIYLTGIPVKLLMYSVLPSHLSVPRFVVVHPMGTLSTGVLLLILYPNTLREQRLSFAQFLKGPGFLPQAQIRQHPRSPDEQRIAEGGSHIKPYSVPSEASLIRLDFQVGHSLLHSQ